MMNNMKVGVVIKHTDGGEREVYSCNRSNTLTKGSNDMRSIFRLFSTPPNGKDLIFLRFLGGEGFLIAIMHLANETNRGDENSTAWLHIPNKIDCSGSDLVELIDLVKTQMVAKRPDFGRIENHLKGKDFKLKDVSQTMLSHIYSRSNSDRYAYRLYGQGTNYGLDELLDPTSLAQEEYKNYSGIILLKNEDSLSFKSEEKITELRSRLKKTVILSTPNPTLALGFQPYYKGMGFESRIEVYIGDTIQLVWKKEGLQDVPKDHTVELSDRDNSDWYFDARPQEKDMKYRISKSDFNVSDEDRIPIRHFSLEIDNQSIEDTNYYSDDDLKNKKKVRIVASGYELYESELLLNNRPPITLIRMNKEYTIELINGLGKLIIDGRAGFHRVNKESPLKGYELIKGSYLRYKNETTLPFLTTPESGKRWFEKQWFKVIALLVVGISLGGIIGSTLSYMALQRHQRQSVIVASPHKDSGSIEENRELSSPSISDYMDGRDTWSKDSLPAGLFEALINLKLEEIKNFSKEVSSKQLNEIQSKLQEHQKKDQLDKLHTKIQGKLQQMIHSINVKEYVNLISQDPKDGEDRKPSLTQGSAEESNGNPMQPADEKKGDGGNKRGQK